MHIRSLSLFLFDQLKKPFFLLGLLFGASLITLLVQKPSFTQAETISLPNTPETIERVVNGSINSIAIDDAGNSYIGGNFSRHGLNVPYRLVLNTDTEEIDAEYPRFNNNVSVVISDGSGGWYVGGEFTQVDSENRNYLIHILADKSVDLNWSPNPNGAVRALRLDGNTLYVGGYFTNIAGESRNYIAAFNAPTGALLAWDPGITNTAPLSPSVSTIDVDSDTVYFGGGFSHVDGSSRYSVASANKTTADLTLWNPNPNNTIYTLLVDGTTIYIGGQYSNIGGEARNVLAAVNNTDGAATAFNPNPDQAVYSLLLDNDILYVGGAFDTIGGETRYGLAAIDTNTSLATAFETGGTDAVTIRGSMLLSEGILYVGGDSLGTFGGAERVGFAAVDVSTGIATDLDLGLDSIAVAFAKNGNDLFVGGTYKVIDSVARKNILSLDASQSLRAWNPNADSTIHAITLSDNLVYIGGEFSEVGGELRNYIAALDPTTGLATAWNPNADSTIYTITLSDNLVYIGGNFSEVGGEFRNYIAALDPTTGFATAWNPNADSTVYDLLAANEVLYVGGDFETIGGESRSYLAELDFSTGLAGSWNPDLDNTVQAIAVYNNSFFAGGLFNYAGDFHSPYLAMFVESTTESTPAPSVLPTPNPENITPPQCLAGTPNAPDLFQVVPGASSVKLFFTSVSNSQEYFISYSTEPSAELHSATISLAGTGVQTYTINYLKTGTVYYFKVRGQNGCMPGEWSEIYGVRTLSFGSVFEQDFTQIGSSVQPPTLLPDSDGDDSLPMGRIEEVLQERAREGLSETRFSRFLPLILGITQYLATLRQINLLEFFGPLSIALSTIILTGISMGVPILQVGKKHTSQVFLHLLHGLGVLQYKNPQGVVYDARTNEPIPFALLTIRSEGTLDNTQVQETIVTDTEGTYHGIELPQGSYTISASHQEFSFPTKQQRPKFLTVEQHYRGEVFAADMHKQQLYIVPLDKLVQAPFVRKLQNTLTRLLEKFSLLHTFWPLFGLSVGLFAFYPSFLNGLALALQSLVVVKKVGKSIKKPAIKGVISDSLGKPIHNALVRITTQTGTLVALTSSDVKGRYSLDIPRGEYQISVLKTGYVWQQLSPAMTLQLIDIRTRNQVYDIHLTPASELYSSVFTL